MQGTAGVVDIVALAQGIQAVALARVQVARHLQRIQHGAVVDEAVLAAHQGEFVVDEADVERRVVNDQFRARHEGQEIVDHVLESRLVGEEFPADAVHFERAVLDLAAGVQVLVVPVLADAPVDQFDAADFNDPVSF